MTKTKEVPITVVEGHEWLALKHLFGRKAIARAGHISLSGKVSEKPSGHRVSEAELSGDEAKLESSIKIRGRNWEII